ncbi:hypothetical protein TPR58_12860 [Sphingomonas sp. HF-S3]|uniref:Uncharacterized protein n=1 Tax=Sphingomonas rustica TaxID=3103142 RepID=A0ABV0B912_9SPHN
MALISVDAFMLQSSNDQRRSSIDIREHGSGADRSRLVGSY